MSSLEERLSTREILNRTNEVFFGQFGKLAAPALVAGFLGYWVNWGHTWVDRQMAVAFWRHAHGNANAVIRAVVIPGIALRFLFWAMDFVLWGVAFAIIAQLVVSFERKADGSFRGACKALVSQQGWMQLLWGLYWRLTLPGFLLTLLAGPAGYWILNALHINYATSQGKLVSEFISLIAFNLVFLLYARPFTLAIPAPIVAGDTPVDPFQASAKESSQWKIAIIVCCLIVWGLSDIADLHLAPILLRPELIQPTVVASYSVWILVGLVTNVPWAWLFVFLTEIAITEAPAETVIAEVDPNPVEVLNS